MNRRALVIAFIVAILGAALLAVYLRRLEREASGGESIKLLSALKPIEAGTLITEDMLAVRLVPRAYVEDRAVLERDMNKVVGLRMGQTIQSQQTLMWTDLQIAMEERRNLSSLIQQGMRAVTVAAATRGDKSYALVRPGDRIDVIATLDAAGAGKGDEKTAIVLLQKVLVLAVGIDTGGEVAESGGRDNDLVLSLSITLAEAQLLALATEKGNLSVALRNPHDVRITEGIAELSSKSLTEAAAKGYSGRGGRPKSTGPTQIKEQQ